MGQFTFRRDKRMSVVGWVASTLGVSVVARDPFFDSFGDSTWNNYRCTRGRSVALVSISEHERMPGRILVTVSTDLRRMWRLPRIYGDFQLALAIARIMRENGGTPLDD